MTRYRASMILLAGCGLAGLLMGGGMMADVDRGLLGGLAVAFLYSMMFEGRVGKDG